MFDTIVAPITGTPPAAVAWLRLSGEDAWQIARQVFDGFGDEITPRLAVYGRYASGDDGLAIPFRGDASYTGEDAVELSCHGSKASIDVLMDACLRAGARAALPGEFTQRAFLHGKIDLTQAEGVRESCEAETAAQLRLASRLREGKLREQVNGMRKRLLGLLAALEASVDFSEEIGDFDRSRASTEGELLRAQIASLISTAESGRILREGYRIAIVGPPNAGKSSLLNAMLGMERAIVTEIAGTTRDYVEERASFFGVPVVLIDTAGLRETADPVESIGVQRSRAIAAQADEVWFVFDACEPVPQAEEFGVPNLLVANKSDLCTPSTGLAVSALTGEGISLLMRRVADKVGDERATPFVNTRHLPLLERADEAIAEFLSALEGDSPDDLLSVLLNEAIESLGEITGETASPDMIQQIFADFCIGK